MTIFAFLSIIQWVWLSLFNISNTEAQERLRNTPRSGPGCVRSRSPSAANQPDEFWWASPGCLPELSENIHMWRCTTPLFTEALFTVARTWKQPMWALTEDWKQVWCIHTMTYHSAVRWNTATCNTTDGSWEYHAKRGKSDKKGPYDFTQMWDMKLKATDEQTRKTSSQTQIVRWSREGRGLWGSKG